MSLLFSRERILASLNLMIHWNPSPEILSLGPLSLRWYGLLFASGFVAAYLLLKKIFNRQKIPLQVLDRLLMHVAVGTVVGARLGHCLFYDPTYYLSHPLEIFMIWKGGLASHGGALGILIGCWIFSRKQKYLNFLETLDHVCLTVPLAGAFIRLGNLMNSEIYGKPTEVPWAFIFEKVDLLPRHPAQLYEAIAYFLIFIGIFSFYRRHKYRLPEGAIFGLCISSIFTARFILEFFKEAQAEFENNLVLSMGQLLSIPFVIIGLIFTWRALKRLRASDKKHSQ